jgi:hypothetical protein
MGKEYGRRIRKYNGMEEWQKIGKETVTMCKRGRKEGRRGLMKGHTTKSDEKAM